MINSSLQSLIQKFVQGKTENVIEFEFLVGEEPIPMHSVQKGSTFEQSSWVFLFESKQLSGCFSESGEQKMDSPNFSLVFKSVFADQLQFVINSFFFERSSGCIEGGRI